MCNVMVPILGWSVVVHSAKPRVASFAHHPKLYVMGRALWNEAMVLVHELLQRVIMRGSGIKIHTVCTCTGMYALKLPILWRTMC